MAKRKSSKTTAQSDPTISEDQKKNTSDSLEAATVAPGDDVSIADTVSPIDETPTDPVDAKNEGDTLTAFGGDDTVLAQEVADAVIIEDSKLAPATPDTEDTLAPPQGDDMVLRSDEQPDAVSPNENDDTVTTMKVEDSVWSTDAADSVLAESIEDGANPNTDSEAAKTSPNHGDSFETSADATIEEPEKLQPRPTRIIEPAPEPQPKPRTVMPLIFGGFIAALLGFVAARTEVLDSVLPGGQRAEAPTTADPATAFDDSVLTSQMETLASRLAALEGTVETRFTALEGTVAALPESQEPTPAPKVDLSKIEADISALTSEIESIKNQPVAEAPVPTEALDAALAELRAKASEQQAEIDKLLADQQNTIKDAEIVAKATLARTAMTAVQSAINAGMPFDAPLGELEQTGLITAPAELSGIAADGVTSLAELQETFPDAARDALYAARDAETGSGLVGFLELQLGTRSIAPQEGTDPDAVLSRIEAAIRSGDLDTALTEAEALPAPAQDAMSTWIEKAQSRHNAVLAANALAERLSAL